MAKKEEKFENSLQPTKPRNKNDPDIFGQWTPTSE